MSTGPRRSRRPTGLFAEPALALAFLTILPVRLDPGGDHDLGRAAPWFGVVGTLVGLAAGGAYAAVDKLAGPGPGAVAGIAVLAILTGALHQDGLADTADGIGARGAGPERRLAAMRDPATGSFGTLALIGWALALYAGLREFADADEAVLALVAAGAVSRWAALLHAALAPAARADGLGAGFSVAPVAVALGVVPAAGVALVAADARPGAAAVVAAAVTAWLVAALARRLLGGRTGDTLGATVALAEVAAVLAIVAA